MDWALPMLHSRARWVWGSNPGSTSPPTRRVGESGRRTPVSLSSRTSSSYSRSYSASEMVGSSRV